MIATDILLFHPEIQEKLDEIEANGWEYLFLESIATAFAELDLEKSDYSIRNLNAVIDMEELLLPEEKLLELRMGSDIPKIVSVREVQKFEISISTKNLRRAVTVDLAKNVVTSLGDQFWKWEKDWESDVKKLSDARTVLKIASWFLNEKGYKLDDSLSRARYDESVPSFRQVTTRLNVQFEIALKSSTDQVIVTSEEIPTLIHP